MSVAGFGFRAGASMASLVDALARAGGATDVTMLAAPTDKAFAPCLQALAAQLAMQVADVSPDALAAAPVMTHSALVLALRGTGSVAEACALVAAGEGATLLGPRVVSVDRLATCAIAWNASGSVST